MRLVLWAVFIALLSACATPPLPITDKSRALAAKLQQQNAGLDSWVLSGRASVSTETAAYYFNVFWQQHKQQYELRFDVSLVSGVIEVKGHEGFAELKLDKNKTIQGTNPDQLIAQLTPFNIPVTGLRSWIRGIPHKNSNRQMTIQANGQTKVIKQDGWLIEYSDWQDIEINKKRYTLPSDMQLSREDLTIRIQPSKWQQQALLKTNPIFDDLNF